MLINQPCFTSRQIFASHGVAYLCLYSQFNLKKYSASRISFSKSLEYGAHRKRWKLILAERYFELPLLYWTDYRVAKHASHKKTANIGILLTVNFTLFVLGRVEHW